MNKHLLGGLASLVVPLGLYGAPPTSFGSYQRSYLKSSVATPLAPALTRPWVRESCRVLPDPSPIEADDLVLQSGHGTRELVIIDQAVPDKTLFYQSIKPGVEVKQIQSGDNGLSQLIAILAQYQNLDALHIVSHADDGVIYLGNSRVTEQLLRENVETLSALDNALKPGADLLLYGCNLAKGASGEQLLDMIAANADIDVAASDDYTGAGELNGDWDLEIQRGDIESH
ncbi:MAG: DUF4347 domain-containing protein, partial [Psychrosphaera sp.]|nr:DUF4347 domain-containing protein [Psychrosphaera sp.]